MESNLAEEWKKVGFGWTNKSTNHLITSSTKVSFLIDPQIIHFNNFYEEFPSKSFHDYLLEQFTTFPFHDSHKFQQIIQYFLQQYFIVEKSQFLSHYNDFLLHEGRSNERQLRWDIMHIPANLSFNLHAHPNIEIIWVLSGTIHEYRLVNNTNPTDFVQQYLAERADKTSPSIKGPNLANVSDLQFVYNSVSAIPETELTPEISMERLRSAFIINEIGSIHLSFTRDEETTLLVVWSGGHANVPKDEYPSHSKDLFPLVTKDDPH